MEKNTASGLDSNKKSQEKNSELVDFLQSEILERKKIELTKEIIVEDIQTKKNDYLNRLEKQHKDRLEKIKSNDMLLDDALKSGDANELKKSFEKLIEESKK